MTFSPCPGHSACPLSSPSDPPVAQDPCRDSRCNVAFGRSSSEPRMVDTHSSVKRRQWHCAALSIRTGVLLLQRGSRGGLRLRLSKARMTCTGCLVFSMGSSPAIWALVSLDVMPAKIPFDIRGWWAVRFCKREPEWMSAWLSRSECPHDHRLLCNLASTDRARSCMI